MLDTPFAQSFASEPILIDPNKVKLVSASLEALASSVEGAKLINCQVSADDDFWSEDYSWYRPYVVTNGILQVPVQGVLLNKFSFQFGRWATGYQYIERAIVRGLADPAVKGIALVCDSPGGEVAGCFELADKIYGWRNEKPIKAFSADHAYSAAYALACSAGEVIVSRSGGTGSVGVVTAHIDYSEAMSKEGIKVTFIFAGKHKVDGNAYEKLPDSVKSRIQDRIDRIYGVFTSTVARNRGVEEKAVQDTEALTFDAQDSVANGFADRVGAFEDEMVAFSKAMTDQEGEQLMTTETKPTEPTGFTQAQVDTMLAAARTEAHAAGVTAERERRESILGSDVAKTRPVAAAAFVKKGLDSAMALELLADMPEEKATTPTTVTTVQPKALTPFEKQMAAGNPEVGADGGEDLGQSDDDKAINAIVGAAKAYHGKAA